MTHEELMEKYRQEEEASKRRWERMTPEERRELKKASRSLGKRMQSSVGGDVVEERAAA